MGGIGLVMSGGGARGAYEVGVLSYVFGDLVRAQRRTPPLSIIAGTSVGAVNGAYLASVAHDVSRGVAKLEAMWSHLELPDVLRFGVRQITGLGRVFLGGDEATGLFDSAALSELTYRELDWGRLRQNVDRGVLQALTITATHVMTGRPVVFVDRAPGTPLPIALRPQAVVREAHIRTPHVLASAAIPLVFPPVDIDGYLHCDGGLRLNTPMAPAIHCGADRLFVIGVSSTEVPGAPALPAGRYPGASFLLGKVLNAFLLDHLNMDLMELERTNELLRDGAAIYGPSFVEELSRVSQSQGRPPRRIIDFLAIRPSVDLGRIAADHLRGNQLRFGNALGRSLLRMVDVGQSHEADLASYLLFDGTYARKLIELGRSDARAHKDALIEFLFER